MNPEEAQAKRLQMILDFIKANYATPEQVTEAVSALAKISGAKFSEIMEIVNGYSGTIESMRSSVTKRVNDQANSLRKFSDTTVQRLTSFGSKLDSAMSRLDGMDETLNNIEHGNRVDESGIQIRAEQIVYDRLRPLIPEAESASSIRNKLELSLSNSPLDMRFISGLIEYIDQRMKDASKPIIVPNGGGYGPRFIETQIKAGSNVSVTKDASGNWIISSTANGSFPAWSTPAETPAADGTVTQFTVGATAPTEVNGDGLIYPPGTTWTHNPGTGKITISIGGAGPTQFIRFR